MVRPYSQTGLIRVRQNPNQRHFDAGGKEKGSVLNGVNERLAEEGFYLHPTKGYRRVTARRTAAAVLTNEIKKGVAPWSMTATRRDLKLAR